MDADHIQRAYDAVVDPYAAHFASELDHKPLDRALLALLVDEAAGGLIADLGCGPAQIARHLHDRGARVLGVDLSPAMIERARVLLPACDLRVGDLRALDLPAGSLAAAAMFYAIVHFTADELPAVFAELCRVLAPGAPALISFHVGDEPIHVTELLGAPVTLTFHLFPMIVVTSALEQAGLRPEVRLERVAYTAVEHPTTRGYVIARKPRDPSTR